MIILVDFENTHGSGFEGYEYLNDTDTVVVYYSDDNSAVKRGMVDDLKDRNVNVRMVKLLKQHSNALDMYIASTTGMFLDTGEKICIVSKDKGYAAVRDFWHSLRGAEILLGETIEECFLHSVANDDPRIRSAKERNQKAILTDAFETMNRIPTRPTLSRGNFRRRRGNEDLNRNTDPVEILPNPLLKDQKESTHRETPEQAAANAVIAELVASMDQSLDQALLGEEKSEMLPLLQEEGRTSGAQEDFSKTEHAGAQEEISRAIPKLNPNQVRFVYDPKTRTMQKIGGEEPKEEKTAGAAEAERDEKVPVREESEKPAAEGKNGRHARRGRKRNTEKKAESLKDEKIEKNENGKKAGDVEPGKEIEQAEKAIEKKSGGELPKAEKTEKTAPKRRGRKPKAKQNEDSAPEEKEIMALSVSHEPASEEAEKEKKPGRRGRVGTKSGKETSSAESSSEKSEKKTGEESKENKEKGAEPKKRRRGRKPKAEHTEGSDS